MKEQRSHSIMSILLLAIIFAFALGVLVYVGGAILQTINFTTVPQPTTSLESAIIGGILGIIFGFIQRRKHT